MTAVMFEPSHPHLRELWQAARTDARPDALRARRPHRAGAAMVVIGMFLLGVGAGGLVATLPALPKTPFT